MLEHWRRHASPEAVSRSQGLAPPEHRFSPRTLRDYSWKTRKTCSAAVHHMLIGAPDFAVENDLRVLALQGHWGLTNLAGPGGGRLVISDRTRARAGCERLLQYFAASDAQSVCGYHV